jgi:hypothetical protein
MTEEYADYDSPWKEMLERYFQEFLAFFFPQAHDGVDWTRGYELLDKELQQLVRDAELGRRLVDKLVKVWRHNGEAAWVIVHIEVQGQRDADFARRMYVYNYRLFDRYDRRVASLAVLADDRASWRPASYGYELWGCRTRLDFPAVKLLDYEAQAEALEQHPNPFALVVLAHLNALATRQQPEARLTGKLNLVKQLYQRGYSKQDILELFRFIDWVMVLPVELEQRFTETVEQYKEEQKMRYVTSFERIGIQKGMRNTAREAILDILDARFGQTPDAVAAAIQSLDDYAVLKALHRQAVLVETLTDFEEALAQYDPAAVPSAAES